MYYGFCFCFYVLCVYLCVNVSHCVSNALSLAFFPPPVYLVLLFLKSYFIIIILDVCLYSYEKEKRKCVDLGECGNGGGSRRGWGGEN